MAVTPLNSLTPAPPRLTRPRIARLLPAYRIERPGLTFFSGAERRSPVFLFVCPAQVVTLSRPFFLESPHHLHAALDGRDLDGECPLEEEKKRQQQVPTNGPRVDTPFHSLWFSIGPYPVFVRSLFPSYVLEVSRPDFYSAQWNNLSVIVADFFRLSTVSNFTHFFHQYFTSFRFVLHFLLFFNQ